MGWEIWIGNQISIRSNNWIPGTIHFKPYSLLNLDPDITHVSQLIKDTNRTWKADLITKYFISTEVDKILAIHLSSIAHNDCLAWFPSKDGLYLVKKGRWFLNQLHYKLETSYPNLEASNFWKIIWSSSQAPKISYWVWQAALDRLPSNDQFFKWKIIQDTRCLSYNESFGTLQHIIYDCQVAVDIINALEKSKSKPNGMYANHQLLNHWSLILSNNGATDLWKGIIIA